MQKDGSGLDNIIAYSQRLQSMYKMSIIIEKFVVNEKAEGI